MQPAGRLSDVALPVGLIFGQVDDAGLRWFRGSRCAEPHGAVARSAACAQVHRCVLAATIDLELELELEPPLAVDVLEPPLDVLELEPPELLLELV